MKILLTGGAGYIGSQVANLLLDRGHKVTIIDNLITGTKKLIPKNNVILKDAGLMTNDLGFYFVSDNQFNNFLGDPQLMRTKII